MNRRIGLAVVAVVVAACATPALAEVLTVPEAVRVIRGAKDEHLVLRSPDGVVLGEQYVHAVVDADQLRFDLVTRFTNGDEWDERGELALTDGFRARRFDKTMRRAGRVVQKQHVDFTTGKVEWLVDGVRAERTMTLPPDTYVGSMLGMVLGGVPGKSPAAARFSALVFRPDPVVVTVRAEATDERQGARRALFEGATKLRVRADLGPIKNMLLARMIPTHYFWFSEGSERALVGFEGELANGVAVVMTPESPVTTAARQAKR